MSWFALFFFLSGNCSLVCEIVWIRLSMASFGVNATVMSVMLSIFMAGLGLGSYAAGRLRGRAGGGAPGRYLRWYALCELLIGVSGVVMVPLFTAGEAVTRAGWFSLAWGSFGHHAVAGLLLTVIVLPWAVCMGATFPLALAALEDQPQGQRATSFSFLYRANLLGATAGTFCAAFAWIELLGLRGTLWANAGLNLLIALLAWRLSRRRAGASLATAPAPAAAAREPAQPGPSCLGSIPAAGALLLLCGFVSMGLEVVWIRLYTPRMGTSVYAFASVLIVYLLTSYGGTSYYRYLVRVGRQPPLDTLLLLLAGSCALALPATDQRLADLCPGLSMSLLPLLAGVGPFCFLAGMLTPMIIDQHAQGDATLAGQAYARNILGCILGPLAVGFVLLPWAGERVTTVLLLLPLFALALAYQVRRLAAGVQVAPTARHTVRSLTRLGPALAVLLLLCAGVHTPYDAAQPWVRDYRLKRDYEATALAVTDTAGNRSLYVNGIGMTETTPITKAMAHLPLAHLEHAPERLLVICFGMGTTFRAGLTWDISVDAVDLIPSVPLFFDYFFPEAPQLLASPKARIITDDGRRFLIRTQKRYDVITIDPPPPPDAAASGLLYSTGFYRLAKARLKPGGILQQWYPQGDEETQAALTLALTASFRHVRVFSSVEGWGLHFLASDSPIAVRSATELVARCPVRAQADLIEWGPKRTAAEQFGLILQGELPVAQVAAKAPLAVMLTDDRPVNEYYLVRQWFPGLWRWWRRWL